MKLRWTDEFVLFLINRVHSADFIWNHTLQSYKFKYKKQAFWLALADEMNKIFTANVPFEYDEVTHKWCNIKSYFNSEKHRRDKAKRSGAGADGNLESSWKFYEHLHFLEVVNAHTPSVNNFNKKSLENLNPTNNMPREPGKQLKSDESFDVDFDAELSISFIEDNSEFLPITTDVSTSSISNKPAEETDNTSTKSPPIEIVSDVLITSQIDKTENLSKLANSSKLPHVAKKRRIKNNADLNQNATTLIEASQNLSNAFCAASQLKKDDEKANSFGIYIGEEIAKLDPDLQLKARKQMHDILIDLQCDQLKRNEFM